MNQEAGMSRHFTCWCPGLGLPASKTVKNKCVLFLQPSLQLHHNRLSELRQMSKQSNGKRVFFSISTSGINREAWEEKKVASQPHIITDFKKRT